MVGAFDNFVVFRAGDLSMLVVLLDAGANINKQNSMGHTALFLAAENVNPLPKSVLLGQEDTTDDLSLVQHLLERGADKDLGDADGVTPIMIAANKNKTKLVKILARCPRVDLNLTDSDGKTLIERAIRDNDLTLVETLAAEERCNFEIEDHNGDSLISNAGSPAMVKQLQDIILKRKGTSFSTQ